MMKRATVQQVVDAGKIMDKARDEINLVLNESGLTKLYIILLLDLMAFELKYRTMEE